MRKIKRSQFLKYSLGSMALLSTPSLNAEGSGDKLKALVPLNSADDLMTRLVAANDKQVTSLLAAMTAGAALITGALDERALLILALAAYATYVINAGQFLLKLRAARLGGLDADRPHLAEALS